jgi:HlyD family secretion protein
MMSLIVGKFRWRVRSGLVPVAVIALITACSASYFIPARKARSDGEHVPKAVVRRASFDVCHIASGVAQCPQQTVVKCQLENLRIRSNRQWYFTGGASTILEIIPNGTTVRKGDVLCTLDASEYEELARVQTLNVLSHYAEQVQTDLALQAAQIALVEYREGLYVQDIKGMQGRVALAEAQVKLATDRVEWSERMAGKGYASAMQLANDRAALLSATLQFKKAQTELDTYRRFTAPKNILTLEAEIEIARKWSQHETSDHQKSKDRLALYRSLVERCTIRAPHDGFAIYASGPFREDNEKSIIEVGAPVRQNQELFYLPDLSKMQVAAMLHDTVVDRVRPGMPARVRFEGRQGTDLAGHVDLVEALPRRSFNDVPYYACLITLDVIPPGLLPGMTAEVEIQAGRCRDVLAVPTEAVSLDHDREVCYVIGPSGLERREITAGWFTPDLVEVTDGLNEGEFVALNKPQDLDGTPWLADSVGVDQPESPALAALPRPAL